MNIPVTSSITLNFVLLRIIMWDTSTSGVTAWHTATEVDGTSVPTPAETVGPSNTISHTDTAALITLSSSAFNRALSLWTNGLSVKMELRST